MRSGGIYIVVSRGERDKIENDDKVGWLVGWSDLCLSTCEYGRRISWYNQTTSLSPKAFVDVDTFLVLLILRGLSLFEDILAIR